MPADLVYEPLLVPSGVVPIPTITAGAGAGTGPTVSLTGGSNMWRGTCTVLTGTTPAAGLLCNVVFPTGIIPTGANVTPFVVIFAGNGAAAALVPIADLVSTTGFSINCENAPTATTTYTFSYLVIFQ